MIELIGNVLHQWDVGRKVKISNKEAVDEVHFARFDDSEALVVKPKEVDGSIYADIPNILLQTSRNITVYVVKEDVTIRCCTFQVMKRQKPADYVYTETEVLSYKALDERIKALEEHTGEVSDEDIAKAVESYLSENPVQAGATEEQARQIEKNAEDIIKLSKEIVTPVQSDWNQNDETALDYIKNRVGGYTKYVHDYFKRNEKIDTSTTKSFDTSGWNNNFNVGDIVIVTIDGVEYRVVGEAISAYGMEFVIFGNKLYGLTQGVDTGEPFYFYRIVGNDPYTYTFDTKPVGEYTISIAKVLSEEVVKIPSKYLDFKEYDDSEIRNSISAIRGNIINLSEEIEDIKENGSGGSGTTPVQSDWNQVDSDALDYVKNRPFYHDVHFTDVSEEKTVTLNSNGSARVGLLLNNSVEGKQYYITINGSEHYLCTATYEQYEAVWHLLGSEGYELLGGTLYCHLTNKPTEPITVKLQEGTIDLKQLDEEFIPDTIARKSDVVIPEQVQADWNEDDENSKSYIKNRIGGYYNRTFKEFLSNRTFSSMNQFGVNGADVPTEGQKCRVIFNGKEYISTVLYTNSNATNVYIGNKSIASSTEENTGEPFYCTAKVGSTTQIPLTVRTNLSGSCSISIDVITSEEAVKIPSEFLELPNTPSSLQPLTFTGAVTGTYDGSEPLSIEIPSGGSGGTETVQFLTTTEEVSSIENPLPNLEKCGQVDIVVHVPPKQREENATFGIWMFGVKVVSLNLISNTSNYSFTHFRVTKRGGYCVVTWQTRDAGLAYKNEFTVIIVRDFSFKIISEGTTNMLPVGTKIYINYKSYDTEEV